MQAIHACMHIYVRKGGAIVWVMGQPSPGTPPTLDLLQPLACVLEPYIEPRTESYHAVPTEVSALYISLPLKIPPLKIPVHGCCT